MRAAPLPHNEVERLAALDRYAVLDTSPEHAFDELAELASSVCETPMALISLIDETRQWFKARVGIAVAEIPRELAFCAHVILGDELLVVPDSLRDDRFADNPLVTGEPHIRFYAGAPLTTPDGLQLGTLCVLDRKPRTITAQQGRLLAALAHQVVVQLELRRQVGECRIAEDALRVSELRTRAVIDNSLGGVITTDRRGRIESFNPAAERIFGYTSEEVIGRSVCMLAGRTFPSNRDCLRYLRDNAVGRVTELEGRRRDGRRFTAELSLFDFWHGGERHFAGHVLDVSGRDEVDRLKNDFVATVSHELRTPLTSIRGSLGLLAAGAMGELGDEARQMVEVAERNTTRLITLINDILDFDKLESGRVELAQRPVPLLRVLKKAVESVSAAAAREDIAVELHGEHAILIGDEMRLTQLMVNLLSNAVTHSPRGGAVRIEAATSDGWTTVRVSDAGQGIPAELQGRLYQRFQQVEEADSREKGGTGLGLAICKAIVELHGGTVGVESTPGSGSTFWFRVPALLRTIGSDRMQA